MTSAVAQGSITKVLWMSYLAKGLSYCTQLLFNSLRTPDMMSLINLLNKYIELCHVQERVRLSQVPSPSHLRVGLNIYPYIIRSSIILCTMPTLCSYLLWGKIGRDFIATMFSALATEISQKMYITVNSDVHLQARAAGC